MLWRATSFSETDRSKREMARCRMTRIVGRGRMTAEKQLATARMSGWTWRKAVEITWWCDVESAVVMQVKSSSAPIFPSSPKPGTCSARNAGDTREGRCRRTRTKTYLK